MLLFECHVQIDIPIGVTLLLLLLNERRDNGAIRKYHSLTLRGYFYVYKLPGREIRCRRLFAFVYYLFDINRRLSTILTLCRVSKILTKFT